MKQKLPVPIALPAFAWLIGLLLASSFQIPFLLCTSLLIGTLLLYFVPGFRTAVLLISILLLAVIRTSIDHSYPSNHISNVIINNDPIMQPIKGKIVSDVLEKEGRFSFYLQLRTIADVPITGKIKFSTSQDSLKYGDEIYTVAKIKSLSHTSNPYAFDYENLMKRKKIFASGYSMAPVKISNNSGFFVQRVIIKIRKFLKARIEERFGTYAGFVKAITIGDKTELDLTRDLLNKAGLSHILAVSGLHVGVLSLIIFQVFIILFHKRNSARILLIVTLIFYGAICNWSASVLRAVIMISLLLISRMYQRKVSANQILAISFIIITAIEPSQILSAGFQMSFLAVFTLLNILPRIRFISINKDEIIAMKMSKRILNSIFIIMFSSFILNLFLAPVTMIHFKQFGFNGIIGNLLGIPLIGIILPLAFLVILLPQCPLLISTYHSSFLFLMQIFEKWSNIAASFPLHFDFISISTLQIILLYASFGFLWLCFKRKKLCNKLIFYRISIIITVCYFIFVSINRDTKLLKVTFFDCGLGDLFLIETPENESIMIDTGPPDDNFGSFKNSALPYLQNCSVKQLDWLIITHAHNDHYGGYKDVFATLDVKNLAVTDEFCSRKIWTEFKQIIAEEDCIVHTITDTLTIIANSIKLKLLHPDLSFHDKNKNNMSIVARLDFNHLSILFTGDLEHEGEEHLIKCYPILLDCDILKVGHHGSKTASSVLFLDAVSPDFAFISTSLQNRFNFPHSQAMENLKFLENNLFISGEDGALQITTDGKTANFKTFLSGVNFTISLTK
jgi:competence protein ComEC